MNRTATGWTGLAVSVGGMLGLLAPEIAKYPSYVAAFSSPAVGAFVLGHIALVLIAWGSGKQMPSDPEPRDVGARTRAADRP